MLPSSSCLLALLPFPTLHCSSSCSCPPAPTLPNSLPANAAKQKKKNILAAVWQNISVCNFMTVRSWPCLVENPLFDWDTNGDMGKQESRDQQAFKAFQTLGLPTSDAFSSSSFWAPRCAPIDLMCLKKRLRNRFLRHLNNRSFAFSSCAFYCRLQCMPLSPTFQNIQAHTVVNVLILNSHLSCCSTELQCFLRPPCSHQIPHVPQQGLLCSLSSRARVKQAEEGPFHTSTGPATSPSKV